MIRFKKTLNYLCHCHCTNYAITDNLCNNKNVNNTDTSSSVTQDEGLLCPLQILFTITKLSSRLDLISSDVEYRIVPLFRWRLSPKIVFWHFHPILLHCTLGPNRSEEHKAQKDVNRFFAYSISPQIVRNRFAVQWPFALRCFQFARLISTRALDVGKRIGSFF